MLDFEKSHQLIVARLSTPQCNDFELLAFARTTRSEVWWAVVRRYMGAELLAKAKALAADPETDTNNEEDTTKKLAATGG